MNKHKKFVVKFGTENLFGGSGHLHQETFNDYAKQINFLFQEDIKIIMVSSGAIVAGKERIKTLRKDDSLFSKKELASIGMRHLCNMWGKAFEKYNLDVAPVLVTYANWKAKEERKSIQKSILGCCCKGFIPLINENDVVSDEEILSMEKGISENDRLARMIGVLIQADGVLFLTNVPGIYESNPKEKPNVRFFTEIDYRKKTNLGPSLPSTNGRGGIETKTHEAMMCKRKMPFSQVVVAGNEKDIIVRFVHGEPIGTCFCTRTTLVPS